MDIKNLGVNTLRLLSLNQIEKANSGHPGIALGAAPIVFTLYNSVMNYNPNKPTFLNRDRFVLSAGHGSSLLYSALHMFGFNVTMNDLKGFRQVGSVTPGHPEYGLTEGVETSTGPLGQGVGNAVGMAIAAKHLASTFNKPNYEIINNKIYCLVGDGCLMEGVATESLSLAGNLCLSNLVVIYDKNDITIEGNINLTFTENTKAKYKAMGFRVIEVADGNNLEELEEKLLLAKAEIKKPTMVIVNTKIGFGSELVGTNTVHGKPLNKKQIETVKQNLNFSHKAFTISAEVKEYVQKSIKNNGKQFENYQNMFKTYKEKHFGSYDRLDDYLSGAYLERAIKDIENLEIDSNLSLRDMSFNVLDEIKVSMPNLLGGAADVAPSTKAYLDGFGSFAYNNYSGKNIHFGVREHAMSAVVNGINLFGGLKAFGSTYLSFTDYMKAGIRMSALMNIPSLFIVTHDSVLIGEDGPTHQPVEQLVGLRAMPNVKVYRPSNVSEVKASYIEALSSKNPSVIILAKQKVLAAESEVKDALKGGYILEDEKGGLDLILLATGSEVEIALKAKKLLEENKLGVRVVSMNCFKTFNEQSNRYKNNILPKKCLNRIGIEAGSSYSMYKYIGLNGKLVTVDAFGESGKPKDVALKYGITVESILECARQLFPRKKI